MNATGGLILDLDAIEARAKAATPGPWSIRPREFDDWGTIRAPKGADGFAWTVAMARSGKQDHEEEFTQHRRDGTDPYGANAAHIAGMDPPTTLALIAEIQRLREEQADWSSDMDAAPKDGTPILVVAAGWVGAAFFEEHDGSWYEINTHWTDAHDGTCVPTRWRPMPKPPAASA